MQSPFLKRKQRKAMKAEYTKYYPKQIMLIECKDTIFYVLIYSKNEIFALNSRGNDVKRPIELTKAYSFLMC